MARRSTKKPKDKNAPKRAMSSYFLFSNQRRPKLREQYPEKKITDISKLISVEWKEMDDAQKKPYIDQAHSDKAKWKELNDAYRKTPEFEEYTRLVQRWKEEQKEGANAKHRSNGSSKSKKYAHKKNPPKPKDRNAPKRALTSYFLFTAEQRREMREQDEKEAESAKSGGDDGDEKKEDGTKSSPPKKSVTAMSKVLGARWKELGEEGQKPYVARAKELKVRYEEQMKAYRETPEFKEFEEKMAEWKMACKQVKRYNERMDRKRREAEESDSSDDESSSSDDDDSSSSGSTSSSSVSSSGSVSSSSD